MLWQESELFKSSRMKWPFSADAGWRRGDANSVAPALEGCLSERVKQFSYCIPSLGGV